MKVKTIYKILLLLFLIPANIFAQDITGLWKGEMYVDSTKKTLLYEISISEVNGKLVGYSLITFEEDGKLETGTRDITIERLADKIIIDDVSLLDNSFKFIPPKNIRKRMEVTLTVTGDVMTLSGSWSTNRTKRFLSATGTVKLQRNANFKETGLYKKLNNLGLADKLAFKEPLIQPAHNVIKIDSTNLVKAPLKLINPDEEKVAVVTDSVKKVVAIINKPKEEKKVVAAPTAPDIVLVQPKNETAVKPAPATIKQVILKPAPAVVAVVNKPVAVQSNPTIHTNNIAAKQTPKEVVAKQLTSKITEPVIVQKAAVRPPSVAKVSVVKPKENSIIVDAPKPVVLPLPGVLQGAAEINKRTISSTQSVFFQSDSLVLTLYDNGYVDGDTVSVVMNGNVIFSKQGLSTRPVSKTIHIDKNTPDSILLVMYAENLGSIPPNTGLLVVHDGEAIYDVRFSADLSTNAAIILRRKKIYK